MSEITLERIVEMRRDANKYGENYPVYSVSTMLALLDLAERGLAARHDALREAANIARDYEVDVGTIVNGAESYVIDALANVQLSILALVDAPTEEPGA